MDIFAWVAAEEGSRPSYTLVDAKGRPLRLRSRRVRRTAGKVRKSVIIADKAYGAD